jgi:glycosyltransferase involved in cell wall biosynthesis
MNEAPLLGHPPHRILAFSHSAGLKGAERALLASVRQLGDAGHEVTVIVARRGPLIEQLRMAGASVRRHPMPPWLARKSAWPIFIARAIIGLVFLPRLIWIVRRADPCVTYTNSLVTPEGALAAKIVKAPHIWHLREYVPGNETLRGHVPLRQIMRLTALLSDVRLAVSESVATQTSGAGGAAPTVVSAGLDPRRYEDSGYRADEWLRGGSPSIAVVGTLSGAKGSELALDILQALHHDGFGDARLLMAGSGGAGYVAGLRRRIEDLGISDSAHIADFVEDVRGVYAAADVVLVPSVHEAYGLVTLEALAAGRPVVGSASGATQELLVDCGLLADPGNVAQFSGHIQAIVGDDSLRDWLVSRGLRSTERLNPQAEATAIASAADQLCVSCRAARPPG